MSCAIRPCNVQPAADRLRILPRLVDEQVSEARHPPPVAHRVGEQLGELGGVAPASLIAPVGPWLAPYQPAQRYYLIDLQRVAPDDLPYRNLLRAVARLEQSRSPEDVRAVKALRRWLPHRGAEELRRAFVDWLRQMAERMAPPGALVPAIRTLEEASMTLVERVAEWPKAVAPGRP